MKDQIIQKSIEYIYNKSISDFSMRKLSKFMGISTRPIYYYFKNTEDLFRNISQSVVTLLQSYIENDYTEVAFLNAGVGYVLFAKEHPEYYNILVLKEFWQGQTQENNDVDNLMKSKASKKEQEIYQILKTYSLGMAIQASSLPQEYSLERIIQLQADLFYLLQNDHGSKREDAKSTK